MQYKDLGGNEILVGNFIVYPALQWGRTPVLKYGLVMRLKMSKGSTSRPPVKTLGVVSVENSEYRNQFVLQNKGKEITLSFPKRVVVVPENLVPQEVRDILMAADKSNIFK